jgi:transposase
LYKAKQKTNPFMYQVLDKDTISLEKVPYLSTAKRGFKRKSFLEEIVNAIHYKLKTGCQWDFLPVKRRSIEL